MLLLAIKEIQTSSTHFLDTWEVWTFPDVSDIAVTFHPGFLIVTRNKVNMNWVD